MIDVMKVADDADMIINGYAFTKDGQNIKVLNLNHPDRASVINKNAEVLATSMDDIELEIMLDYYNNNEKFMEA